ncbi:pantoate--beta-alanine ligase [bacterium]|nr:pantoate--beta-alanine ligase [bacterium]
MKIISKISELRDILKAQKDKTIGLVPTMGALHLGHESLIKKSTEQNDITVVSVFVNPTQFCAGEDFEKYPRTLESDALKCTRLNVDYIFAPNAEEMYSTFNKEAMTSVCPSFFDVDKLCGKSRIGHFDGVATVVAKLFNIVSPTRAYFGRKDAQQLFIIKKMVRDLNFDIEIVECPIIREESGLAMSSRNSYLTDEDRKEAEKIIFALKKAREVFHNGINNILALSDVVCAILPQDSIEYFEIVNPETFEIYEKTDIIKPNSIALIAVRINGVRLIDNLDL